MLFEYQPSCDGISRIGRYTHELSQVILYFNHYRIPIVRKLNVEAIYVKYSNYNLYIITCSEILIYPLYETNFSKNINDGDDTPDYLLPKLDLEYISHPHELDDLDLRQYQLCISGGYFVVSNGSARFLIMEFDISTIKKYQQEINIPFSKIYGVLSNGTLLLENSSEYLIYSMQDCVNLGKIKPLINFDNTKFITDNYVWEINNNEPLGVSNTSMTIYHPRWYSNDTVWNQGKIYDLQGKFIKTGLMSVDAVDGAVLHADGTISILSGKEINTPVVDYIRLLQPRVELECLKRAFSQRLMLMTVPEELEEHADFEISEYITTIAMAIPNLDFSYFIDHTTFRKYLDTEYKIYKECQYNQECQYNISNLKRQPIDMFFEINEPLDVLIYTIMMQDYPRYVLEDCSFTLEKYAELQPNSWYNKFLQCKYSEVSFYILQKISKLDKDWKQVIDTYTPVIQAYYNHHFDTLMEEQPLDFEDQDYKINFFIYYTIKVWKYLIILITLANQMKRAENPIICLLTEEAKSFVSSYFRNNEYYSIYKYQGVGLDSKSTDLKTSDTLAYDFFV